VSASCAPTLHIVGFFAGGPLWSPFIARPTRLLLLSKLPNPPLRLEILSGVPDPSSEEFFFDHSLSQLSLDLLEWLSPIPATLVLRRLIMSLSNPLSESFVPTPSIGGAARTVRFPPGASFSMMPGLTSITRPIVKILAGKPLLSPSQVTSIKAQLILGFTNITVFGGSQDLLCTTFAGLAQPTPVRVGRELEPPPMASPTL
jgi:hypothetical protein